MDNPLDPFRWKCFWWSVICYELASRNLHARLFRLTSVDSCSPFGWQLAHNKCFYSRLKRQLAWSKSAICHVCNTTTQHKHPLWNRLSYGAIVKHKNTWRHKWKCWSEKPPRGHWTHGRSLISHQRSSLRDCHAVEKVFLQSFFFKLHNIFYIKHI